MLAGILEKDFVSVTRLLVMLAHELQCPFQLPSNVEVVIAHRVNHKDGSVSNKTSRHMITGDESAYGKSEKELGSMLSGVSISDKEEKVDEGTTWQLCVAEI